MTYSVWHVFAFSLGCHRCTLTTVVVFGCQMQDISVWIQILVPRNCWKDFGCIFQEREEKIVSFTWVLTESLFLPTKIPLICFLPVLVCGFFLCLLSSELKVSFSSLDFLSFCVTAFVSSPGSSFLFISIPFSCESWWFFLTFPVFLFPWKLPGFSKSEMYEWLKTFKNDREKAHLLPDTTHNFEESTTFLVEKEHQENKHPLSLPSPKQFTRKYTKKRRETQKKRKKNISIFIFLGYTFLTPSYSIPFYSLCVYRS